MLMILRTKVQVRSLPQLVMVMVMAGGRRLVRTRRTPMMQGLVFRDWCGFVWMTRGTNVPTRGSLVRRTTGLLVL